MMKAYLYKHFGFDSGHVALAPLIGLYLFACGVPAFWAALIATTVWPIGKEAYDRVTKPHLPVLDTFSDLASYQTAWPAVYLAAREPVTASLMLAGVAVVYLFLVWLKLKEVM